MGVLTENYEDELANAMVMVMNDLSSGNEVCDYVKAKARIAIEPFLLEDNGGLPDLDWAKGIVARVDGSSSISPELGGEADCLVEGMFFAADVGSGP